MNVTIYTDGSALGNPGKGGYGTVLMAGKHRKELSQGYKHTTNNRMELLAVIVGLEALKNEGNTVRVYSDSKYVVDAVEKNWIGGWIKRRFKNVKNVDLWKRFIEISKTQNVKFIWVKGHAGIKENEVCDQLAVDAAYSSDLLEDTGYMESIKEKNTIFKY